MTFCGPYDKQLADQYQPLPMAPLWAGWEFRENTNLLTSSAGWKALELAQDWQLSAVLRHDLLACKWAVIITDTVQVIQYVNSQFERMTGYASHEAMGQRPGLLQGAQTCLATRQRIKQAIREAKPIDEHLLNYRKDRSTYWCQIRIRPVFNRQKQLVNFIALEQETFPDYTPSYG